MSVTIGGQPAELAYYGAAPGETAGMMQLTVVVPQNIRPGNAAVVLTVGTATRACSLAGWFKAVSLAKSHG